MLAHGTVDGESLDPLDINMFVMTLLVAGNETTRTHIANSLLALAEHPDQRKLLAEQPDRLVDGVDELLRWEAPIMSFCRTATADTTIAGQPIAEGDYVVLLYQSANRDEDGVRPDRRRARRHPRRRTRTCRSASPSTSAWAPGWPGSSHGCCWRSCSLAGPGTSSPVPSSGSPSRFVRGIEHLPLVLQP